MYDKNKKTIRCLLELVSQKRHPLGEELRHARQEMELAQIHFNEAQGAWIDVCAHALRAAELKYDHLLRLAKEEKIVFPL